VIEARKARSAFDNPFDAGAATGALGGSGGMRTVWPAARRVLALARPPSTRTCPVRNSFSSLLCGKSA
jgi:hypothetical protein